MSGPVSTSVCRGLVAVFDTLAAEMYPVHPDTGEVPSVLLLGDYDDRSLEWVEVVGKVPDTEMEVVATGVRGVSEIYEVTVTVATAVPSQSGREALLRLDALLEVVHAAFRDSRGVVRPVSLLPEWDTTQGGVVSVEVDGGRTSEGFTASADVVIRIYTRI